MWRASRILLLGRQQRCLFTSPWTRSARTDIVKPGENVAELSALVERWRDRLPEAGMDDLNHLLAATVNNVNHALDEFLPSVVAELTNKLEKSDNEQFVIAFALLSRRPIKWFYPDLIKIFDQELFHRLTVTSMDLDSVGLAAEALHSMRHKIDKPVIFSQVLLATEEWEGPEYAIFQYLAYCGGMKDSRVARMAEIFLKTVDPSKLPPRAIACVAQAFLYCEDLQEHVPPIFFADMGLRIKLVANKFDPEVVPTLLLFCMRFKCFFDGADSRLVEQVRITPLWPLTAIAEFVYALSHLQQANDVRHYPVLNEHRRRLELHEVAGQYSDVVKLYVSLAHIGVDVPKWSAVVCRYLAASAELVARTDARGTLRLLCALSELRVLDDAVLESFFRAVPLGGLDFGTIVQFCATCAGQQHLIPDKFWEGMLEHCSADVVAALPEATCHTLYWLNQLAARQNLSQLGDDAEDVLMDACRKRLDAVAPVVREFRRDVLALLGASTVRHDVYLDERLKAPFALLVDENGVPTDWAVAGAEGDVQLERLTLQHLHPVLVRFAAPEEYVMTSYDNSGSGGDGDGTGGGAAPSTDETDDACSGSSADQADGGGSVFALRRQLELELQCFESAGWLTVTIQTGHWWVAEDKACLLGDALRTAVDDWKEEKRRREEEQEED